MGGSYQILIIISSKLTSDRAEISHECQQCFGKNDNENNFHEPCKNFVGHGTLCHKGALFLIGN